jgi:DNA mismatch repair protein MutS
MEQNTFSFLKQASSVTPMMQQYLAIKAEYQDCLLFYRMGDFYEMFFDDAIKASKVLGIALTKRGKHESQDIPMCGVPFHSSESYLYKLIETGFKVAICEQMEKPEEAKKRGYKAVVKREVVRVVTPGTITEDTLLDGKSSNFLASISKVENKIAIAWIDISTGEFYTTDATPNSISSDLSRLHPKEILIPDTLYQDTNIMHALMDWKRQLTPHANSFFESNKCALHLKNFFGVSTLDSFGEFSRSQISACGSIIEYINLTQIKALPKLKTPQILYTKNYMAIDYATRRNLELTQNLTGKKSDTLLSVIDKTVTNAGGRLLASHLSSPLQNPEAINTRLDLVEFFKENDKIRSDIVTVLKSIQDIERAIARLMLGRGGPRDLLAIGNGLTEALVVAEILEFSGTEVTTQLRTYISYVSGFDELRHTLKAALKDDVPMLARDGGFIRFGFNPKLDELYQYRDNSRQKILELKQQYIKETGITNLKLTQNNVLGYFIEVTPQNASKVFDEKFIHRQTLASAVRYSTDELKALEINIINAKDNIQRLELEVFSELTDLVKSFSEKIMQAAYALSAIDVSSSLAIVARECNFVRPVLSNNTNFLITGGRHPVVEASLKKNGTNDFVPNDVDLQHSQHLWLITGPNMAGKSTYLRQNALITIMAQMGSFVPATSAQIGVVDRVFSRVGAADDLARGRSTFMVEMVETATILNQATSKSLIILDEIGRGTSTYDGLSIAWSTLEHIHHKLKSRALFATHYHELTKLSDSLSCLTNYSMAVKEWEGKVIFLHQVARGAADRSYGIHVAELAGLPKSVTERAKEILSGLEKDQKVIDVKEVKLEQLEQIESEIETVIKQTNIDELSPKDALEILYNLKELLVKTC